MPRFVFQDATKKKLKLRMALDGPTGSGKTYTALRLAYALASDPSKVGVLDTENRSASKYIGEDPDGFRWRFRVVELDDYHPQNYIDIIDAAEASGLEVLIIDSLSHAWDGKNGVLELHDRQTRATRSGNSWTAWREVTPVHNALVERLLHNRIHLIVTMRAKMEYTQEKDEHGNTQIKKVGMAPIQRAGIEYEFDIVGDLDVTHSMLVSKSRCRAVDGRVISRPGPQFMETVKVWLDEGEPDEEEERCLTHWAANAETRQMFMETAAGLGLGGSDIRRALGGVSRLSEYQGDLEEALDALRQAAAAGAAGLIGHDGM